MDKGRKKLMRALISPPKNTPIKGLSLETQRHTFSLLVGRQTILMKTNLKAIENPQTHVIIQSTVFTTLTWYAVISSLHVVQGILGNLKVRYFQRKVLTSRHKRGPSVM